MSNTIAVIWDCDKTLIDGYMQDPIFAYYKVNGTDFWSDNNEDIKNSRKQSVRVNDDTGTRLFELHTTEHLLVLETRSSANSVKCKSSIPESRKYFKRPRIYLRMINHIVSMAYKLSTIL